ncbi:Guanylate cyclase soluble subunit beta-2 [Phlyctochytrium planicorne]|nr:Guanylate cyclase soluble subunit beta-2 [Phlyctochytrium planicorne]
MSSLKYTTCRSCDCKEFLSQSGNKRCRDCGHGATLHNQVSLDSKGQIAEILEGKLTVQERLRLLKKDRKSAGASFYIWRNFVVWLILTGGGMFHVVFNGHKVKKFNRGVTDDWYIYTASAFALAVVYSYIAYASATSAYKKSLAKVLCSVNAIAMSSYLIQVFRLTPTFMDYVGHPCDPSRFLEWLATCPVLIYLIAEITKNEHIADETASYDYSLIILGFFAAALKQPFSEICATLSTCFFVHCLWNIMGMFGTAIRGETNCRLNISSLKTAKYVTFGAWNAFTITWYVQRSKIVSYETGEIMFCISDIFAKVFLTLILVNATLEESQNQKASQIEALNDQLEQQMAQADKLLEKLVPPGLIEQLKSGRATGAEEFESVTVFFSDVTNFAALSAKSTTKDMLSTLNKLWLEYDIICKRWGVYKVETIGDAFLGVCGAPDRVKDHAERTANFAIDVLKMIEDFRTVNGEKIISRVGLNSGKITAGILGEQNPHWCIVGDTVNTASRMESTSKPGMIHISESTYELIKGKNLNISEPEVMNIKGKGTMKTYWLIGRC